LKSIGREKPAMLLLFEKFHLLKRLPFWNFPLLLRRKRNISDKTKSSAFGQSMPSMPVHCPCQTLGTVLVYSNHPFDCGFFFFMGNNFPVHEQEQLNELIKLQFKIFQKYKSM
jgi:hypothetical protein